MQINIAQKLKPFSHQAGIYCMIPGTVWCVQAFPCQLVFKNLSNGEMFTWGIDFLGPVEDFTLECDIYTRRLSLFGKEERGFFRFFIDVEESACLLTIEKLPRPEISGFFKKEKLQMVPKQVFTLFKIEKNFPKSLEQLFLGLNKALDSESLKKRKDLHEMLPLWFAIGQQYKKASFGNTPSVGAFLEMEKAREALLEKKTLVLAQHLKKLIIGGFQGILVPEVHDVFFQGLWPYHSGNVSPLPLLFKGYELIRSLFVQEDKDEITLLPLLLPGFVSGRLTGIELEMGGSLQMEWTKSKLRKLILFSQRDTQVTLTLPKEIKKFRLRRTRGERGKFVSVEEKIILQKGHSVLCDHFER